VTDHPMTLALAVRMTIWVLIILAVMFAVAYSLGDWLGAMSEDYPEPMNDALADYSESDNAQDYEEGTEPPRAA
jgi:hypothetical protein